ncbi:peptide ABC transporter substrate-binding protein [Planococcus lenghuensis]|uniref:Peptide ABC transporter substrate-binding protein n=1 Tax=Planococcus lenghuensis TaxID=2213202 RepID=A0A1Q2L2W7_9BACL|nr:peptide ABC transporter substrate-binding protein [Planococcus lenghuensis]AQQ54805.1 peptide ABC transporter substrate-binding protein [Planococcus lenghuensis]
MRQKKLLPLVALNVTFAAALAGCNFSDTAEPAPATTDSGEKSEETAAQVLNLSVGGDIPTLDSTQAHDGIAFDALNNNNEGLYRQDDNNLPALAVAEEHKVSDDGIVHTFTLKDTVWSNGDPVTAHDFEYAWKRVFETAAPYSFMFVTAGVKNAEAILNEEAEADTLGVKAIDDKTLEVTLEAPNGLFETLLTFPTFLPQNQAFVEEQGDQYALEAENVLSNGPFILTDWQQEQGWTFAKNEDYWDAEAVQLDEVNVHVVKDSTTAANLYEAGDIDRVALSASYVDQYKDSEEFTISQQSGIIFLRFNHNHPALGNENIRKAVNLAIDRQGLTDVILKDGSTPLYGAVPGGFYESPEGKDFRELNGDFNKGTAEEAQELFAKGLEEIGQDSVNVSINIADDESAKKTAEYLQAQLQENLPGFTLDIKAVPFAQRLEIEKAIEYDLSLSSWGPDYSDPMTYLDMWLKDGSANRMDYHNPKLDQLVADARVETDKSKRYEMLLELERILLEEDAAIAPLYQSGEAILQRGKVKNLVSHPSGAEFSYKSAYIEE